ncbi:hypothetical protein L7F22_064410 [Adiantum nelumboides]|nr:hypothetical protein [Adiantum nelumboides]
MSGACRSLLLNNSSPPSDSSSDLLLNKYIHVDSPRSSPSLFKRPASPAAGPSSTTTTITKKWKTVLAHLSPPRLLPVPASLRRSYQSRRPPPSQVANTALVIASDVAIPASIRPIDITASDNIPPVSTPMQPLHPHIDITASIPLPSINAVHQLLHILTESLNPNAHSNATGARSHALASLSSLCIASPSAVDLCVAANSVDTVLDILNFTRHDAPATITDMAVEESEKALLLLQLLTSSSPDGCTAALRRSSFTIVTLGRKLLRVSEACTASSIAVLIALCRHPEATPFCKAVSETAIPSKLVVVLQVASKDSTKRRAGRLLRLLGEQQY